MLNIIYSRSRSDVETVKRLPQQGKKSLIRFLNEEYGVICLKKYTSQAQPTQETDKDENLIYLDCHSSSEEEFVSAIEQYDLVQNANYKLQDYSSYPHSIRGVYVYSRIKSGNQCFYGVKSSDIIKALDDYNSHYALVCTNINCLRGIQDDAKKNRKLYRRIEDQDVFQLRAYCLVRETKAVESCADNETNEVLKQLFPHFLKWVAGGSEETDPEIQTLVKKFQYHLHDGRPYFLPYGEDLELDFFKNISLFKNLLIVPNLGEIDTETGWNNYKNAVSPIVEKYMGLRKCKQKIFIIHPMSDIKFSLNATQLNEALNAPLLNGEADVANQFRKFVTTIFKPECDKGYTLRFASDVQTEINKEGVGFLVQKILEELEQSEIIIVDFRNYNHNCIYEAGFSYALKLKDRRRVYFIAPEQQHACMNFLSFDVVGMTFNFYNLQEIIGKPQKAKNEITRFRRAFHLDAWEQITEEEVRAITNLED